MYRAEPQRWRWTMASGSCDPFTSALSGWAAQWWPWTAARRQHCPGSLNQVITTRHSSTILTGFGWTTTAYISVYTSCFFPISTGQRPLFQGDGFGKLSYWVSGTQLCQSGQRDDRTWGYWYESADQQMQGVDWTNGRVSEIWRVDISCKVCLCSRPVSLVHQQRGFKGTLADLLIQTLCGSEWLYWGSSVCTFVNCVIDHVTYPRLMHRNRVSFGVFLDGCWVCGWWAVSGEIHMFQWKCMDSTSDLFLQQSLFNSALERVFDGHQSTASLSAQTRSLYFDFMHFFSSTSSLARVGLVASSVCSGSVCVCVQALCVSVWLCVCVSVCLWAYSCSLIPVTGCLLLFLFVMGSHLRALFWGNCWVHQRWLLVSSLQQWVF